MKKSASEIIHNLDSRISKLEKQSASQTLVGCFEKLIKILKDPPDGDYPDFDYIEDITYDGQMLAKGMLREYSILLEQVHYQAVGVKLDLDQKSLRKADPTMFFWAIASELGTAYGRENDDAIEGAIFEILDEEKGYRRAITTYEDNLVRTINALKKLV